MLLVASLLQIFKYQSAYRKSANGLEDCAINNKGTGNDFYFVVSDMYTSAYQPTAFDFTSQYLCLGMAVRNAYTFAFVYHDMIANEVLWAMQITSTQQPIFVSCWNSTDIYTINKDGYFFVLNTNDGSIKKQFQILDTIYSTTLQQLIRIDNEGDIYVAMSPARRNFYSILTFQDYSTVQQREFFNIHHLGYNYASCNDPGDVYIYYFGMIGVNNWNNYFYHVTEFDTTTNSVNNVYSQSNTDRFASQTQISPAGIDSLGQYVVGSIFHTYSSTYSANNIMYGGVIVLDKVNQYFKVRVMSQVPYFNTYSTTAIRIFNATSAIIYAQYILDNNTYGQYYAFVDYTVDYGYIKWYKHDNTNPFTGYYWIQFHQTYDAMYQINWGVPPIYGNGWSYTFFVHKTYESSTCGFDKYYYLRTDQLDVVHDIVYTDTFVYADFTTYVDYTLTSTSSSFLTVTQDNGDFIFQTNSTCASDAYNTLYSLTMPSSQSFTCIQTFTCTMNIGKPTINFGCNTNYKDLYIRIYNQSTNDWTTLSFQVHTNSTENYYLTFTPEYVMTHSLKLIVSPGIQKFLILSDSYTSTVNVIDKCYGQSLVSPSALTKYYHQTSGIITYEWTNMSYTYSNLSACSFTKSYSIYSLEEPSSAYVSSSSYSIWFKINDTDLTFILNTDYVDQGTYTALIEAKLYYSSTLISTNYQSFSLVVEGPITTNSAPHFKSSLDYIVISPDFDFIYTLPESTDTEGDAYTMTVNLKNAFVFTKYSGNQFEFTPTDSDIGEYEISIILQEVQDSSSKKSYTLKLQVLGNKNTTSSNSSQNNSTSDFKYTKMSRTLKVKSAIVNQTGVLSVKFSQTLNVNISQINNLTLQIQLQQDGQTYRQNLSYDVISVSGNTIKIQLYFPNWNNISISSDQDQIYLKFIDGRIFKDDKGNFCLVDEYLVQNSIPAQISAAMAKTLETIGNTMKIASNTVVFGNIIATIFVSFSLQYLWGMVNVFQLLSHFPLLAVNLPANAQMFYYFTLSISTFNVLPTDSYLSYLLDIDLDNETQLNQQFYQYGYGSLNVIMNLGMLSFFLAFKVLLVAFLIFFKLASLCSTKLQKLYNWTMDKIYLSYFIRFLMEGCLELGLCSLINVTHVRMNMFQQSQVDYNSRSTIIGTTISLSFIIIIGLFPFFIFYYVYTYRKSLQDSKRLKVFGSMYEAYNQNSLLTLNFASIFMTRRLFFSCLWVFMAEYPAIQISIMTLTTLMLLIYNIYTRPLKDKLLNNLEIMNESCCLISLYCYFIYTDWQTNTEMRNNFGWIIISLTILNLVINISTIVIQIITIVIKKAKRKCCQAKQKKMQFNFNQASNKEQQGILQFTESSKEIQTQTQMPNSTSFLNNSVLASPSSAIFRFHDIEQNKMSNSQQQQKQSPTQRSRKNTSIGSGQEFVQTKDDNSNSMVGLNPIQKSEMTLYDYNEYQFDRQFYYDENALASLHYHQQQYNDQNKNMNYARNLDVLKKRAKKKLKPKNKNIKL